jgi:hypothetical protein
MNNLPYGKGTLTSWNGEKNVGIFDGTLNQSGKFIVTWPDGDKYDGDYKRGLPDGIGTFYWAKSKLEYKGEFKKGKRDGKGTLIYSDGYKVEGHWENDKTKDGKVIIFYPNGDKYEGDIMNGKKNGRGIYIFADGRKIEGEYKDDNLIKKIINDKGTTILNNINEKPIQKQITDGKGTVILKNGGTWTGNLKNDKPDGIGQTNGGGCLEFKDGVFIGGVSCSILK